MLAAVLALAVAIGTKLRSRILQRHDLGSAPAGRVARRWRADEAALRPSKSIAGRGHHGGHRHPQADETKHFKLIGTTAPASHGHSRTLRPAPCTRRRAVFADPDWADISSTFTIAIAATLSSIPSSRTPRSGICSLRSKWFRRGTVGGRPYPNSDDPSATEWRGYARTFLAALLRRCRFCGACNTGELWRLLTGCVRG